MDRDSSFFTMLLNVIFLSMLILFSFIWFIYSVYDLTLNIINEAQVITFNKGSMYMFGVGIGLFFLLIGLVQKGLFKKDLSEKKESFLIRGSVIGIIVMFSLPIVVDYFVEQKIRKENYVVCSDMSYQWFLYKKFVYTSSNQTCVELVRQKITHKQKGAGLKIYQ